MIPFAELPLTIPHGRDYKFVLQPSTARVIYKPVTAIANNAPVRLTVDGHGIPPGWAVQPIGRAGASPLLLVGPQRVTVVDVDTIELNARHSLDWPAYAGGVQLAFNEPLSLDGYAAVLRVYHDRTDAAVLFSLTEGEGLTIADSTLSAHFTAAQTALIAGETAKYDLTVSDASGSYLLARGTITMLAMGPQ